MGLPVSRDSTLAPLSKILSSLMNNLQDAIISLFGPRKYKTVGGYAQDSSGTPVATSPNAPLGTAPYTITVPLTHLRSGDRLTDVKAFVKQTNGGSPATATIWTTSPIGTGALVGTVTGPGSTGEKTLDVTGGLPYTLSDGEALYVVIGLNAATDKYRLVEYTVDRLTF